MRLSMCLMISVVVVVLVLASCGTDDNSCAPAAQTNDPVVVFETSLGDFAVVLYPRSAPKTVDNFLRYVNEGFYDSLTFHRVISDFIIQGGHFDENLQKKPAYEPIPSEADNGLSNIRGTIAMARTFEPHSATCQFFINLKDNPALDFSEETPNRWGYCVFGKVILGLDVVDEIEKVETTTRDGMNDVPEVPVVIVRLYVGN